MNRIAVNICTKDRPTELALLLNSLREQTVQDFDVFILDDCGGTPLQVYHFFNCIVERLKAEGHIVSMDRTPFNYGVSKSRQTLADKSKDYEFIMRVDDDVFLEKDYIARLLKVIDEGYDLASGVTPFAGAAGFVRNANYILPIGNKVVFNESGNIIYNGDDCGMLYDENIILPLHHFRSCALYKTKIHKNCDYKSKLGKHGFREEQILSFKMIMAGYKLGMCTQAIAWHLLTPSGGERFANQGELIKFNQDLFVEWTKEQYKEHGDFIKEYNKRLGIFIEMPSEEEQIKECNLVRI